jgi:hypothetical protein
VSAGGDLTTTSIGNNVSGAITVGGLVDTMTISGSETSSGVITVIGDVHALSITGNLAGHVTVGTPAAGKTLSQLSVGGDLSGVVLVYNTLATAAVHGSLSGAVTVTSNLNTLTVDGDISGGASVANTLGALTVGGSVSGQVSVGGDMITTSIGNNVSGAITAGGLVDSMTISGSETSSGVITVAGDLRALQVTASIVGEVTIGGNVATFSVGQNVSGAILISGNVSSTNIGGSVSGTMAITGNATTISIHQNISGTIQAGQTVTTFTLGGSVTDTGVIQAGAINFLTIAGDMAGALNVTGKLATLVIEGSASGTISAGDIDTLGVYLAHGPIVANITEGGVSRRIEAALPENPYPNAKDANTPDGLKFPSAVTFQYFYDSRSSVGLSNPSLGIRVTNPTGLRFDLSLVTYSSTAKFNLIRLDTPNASQPAGVRNLVIEGDLLRTEVSSTFSASDILDTAGLVAQLTPPNKDGRSSWLWSLFSSADKATLQNPSATLDQKRDVLAREFNIIIQGLDSIYSASRFAGVTLSAVTAALLAQAAPDLARLNRLLLEDLYGARLARSATPVMTSFFGDAVGVVGVQLPADHLAGVAVRDVAPQGYIRVSTIQGLAAGAMEDHGNTIVWPQVNKEKITRLLAGGSLIQANDTFRVAFADGYAVPFFMVEHAKAETLDPHELLFMDQLPSGLRGGVTALIKVVAPLDGKGKPMDAVIQTIDFRGDGGSVSTDQTLTHSISSSGPLGDVSVHGGDRYSINITAPSIIGSIDLAGPITGTLQTTGQRLDPITGVTSAIPADWGRAYSYLDKHGETVWTMTTVSFRGSSLSGRLISRGNMVSLVKSDGDMDGLLAVQGSLGAMVGTNRLGGVIINGETTGQIAVLGNVYGDVTLSRGLKAGSIAIAGNVLSNLKIGGSVDSASSIVCAGSIGSAANGTYFTLSALNGILAVEGSVNWDKLPKANQARFYGMNLGPANLNSAVVNAIFTNNQQPLTFDLSNGLDLQGLGLILQDLAALNVNSGLLTGTIP